MAAQDQQAAPVSFTIQERPEIPVLGLLLGGSAMVPFVLLAGAMWLGPAAWASPAMRWLVCWGAAILAFLAGVRRGLSFRTPGGERPAQIATMIWLYLLAIAALLVTTQIVALASLMAGFLSIAVLDPAAARRQEAPLFFARLRPVQMAVPVFALAAAGLWVWRHT